MHRFYTLHKIGVQRAQVFLRYLYIRGIGHGGIKVMPILCRTFMHDLNKIFYAIAADSGFGVRSDIGRINFPDGYGKWNPSGKGRYLLSGMATDAISCARKVSASTNKFLRIRRILCTEADRYKRYNHQYGYKPAFNFFWRFHGKHFALMLVPAARAILNRRFEWRLPTSTPMRLPAPSGYNRYSAGKRSNP